MADSDTLLLALGEQIAALGTRLDALQSEIGVHRESDYSRLETIEAELVALRDLLARAIAERNRAIADLARHAFVKPRQRMFGPGTPYAYGAEATGRFAEIEAEAENRHSKRKAAAERQRRTADPSH